MRAVRITDSNGHKGVAVPLRLEFLLERAELETLLCYDEKDSDEDEPLPDLTRAQVIARVRSTLRYAGEQTPGYWSDYLSDDRADEIHKWAETTIERCFGDMLRAAGEESK